LQHSDVFNFVASNTSYKNNDLTYPSSNLPQLNLTGTIPGPLNPDYYVPYVAPNTNGTGGGSGKTFVAPNVNTSLTSANAPAPVNITSTGAATGLTSNADGVLAAVIIAAVVGMLL
jgi:hypothetical protein